MFSNLIPECFGTFFFGLKENYYRVFYIIYIGNTTKDVASAHMVQTMATIMNNRQMMLTQLDSVISTLGMLHLLD